MSLWEDAAAQKAGQESQINSEAQADERLAQQQRAELREFVEAMNRLGVAPISHKFWYNTGGRDSKGTKKARIPTMEGWTIKHDAGSYDTWPTHYFVALDGDVYSSSVPPHQKLFSKPPLPKPLTLPLKGDYWGEAYMPRTLGERLREVIAEHMK